MKKMTFNDVFKSSFLDSFSSFSLLDTALCLGAAFVIGLFIFYVYQKTYSGVLYSRSFNVSLVAILMVTTLVICGVTSNVVLSLGMVGALSIVRFRTAVKRSDGFGVPFLGNRGGYSLRRKPAASGTAGLSHSGHLPACFCKSSAEG